MLEKIEPLWKKTLPWKWYAIDTDNKIIAEGESEEKAKNNAIVKGEDSPYVVSGYYLQRSVMLPKEIKEYSLVLVGHDWKKAKIFFVKRVRPMEDTATIYGLYLTDLLAFPWMIFADNSYVKKLTIKYKNLVFDKERDAYAYEPVVDEVKKYLPDIQYYIEKGIFNKNLPNYINQNAAIKRGFAALKQLIKITN